MSPNIYHDEMGNSSINCFYCKRKFNIDDTDSYSRINNGRLTIHSNHKVAYELMIKVDPYILEDKHICISCINDQLKLGNIKVYNEFPNCIVCNMALKSLDDIKNRAIVYLNLELIVTRDSKIYRFQEMSNVNIDKIYPYNGAHCCSEHFTKIKVDCGTALNVSDILKLIESYLWPNELMAKCWECNRKIMNVKDSYPIYKGKNIVGLVGNKESQPDGVDIDFECSYRLDKDKTVESYIFICYSCSNKIDYLKNGHKFKITPLPINFYIDL